MYYETGNSKCITYYVTGNKKSCSGASAVKTKTKLWQVIFINVTALKYECNLDVLLVCDP